MANDNFSVTVIIPVHSRPELLLETIKSVYLQKGNLKIKVIVVDDHSPVPITKLLHDSFAKIRVIRNKKVLKSGPTRNQAIKFIDTDFVAFLDADDIWNPDFLSTSIAELSRGNYVGSIAMSTPIFDKDMSFGFKTKIYFLSWIRNFFQIVFYLFYSKTMPQEAFYLCQLSHQVYKADRINGLLFDPKYNFGGEDWKFALEVMDRGKIIIIPRMLIKYRYHKKSTTLLNYNLTRKWASYRQLFGELKKRKMGGIMVWLFNKYIDIFKSG
ncbi:MAG: glycosyltransferase family 2 protein [Candidatus Woesebacteria bacterium]|nr:glycosyltransferase family 2 protein [Candidatus Woesebacteria bacterium]